MNDEKTKQKLETIINRNGGKGLKSFEYIDSEEEGWGWTFKLENGKSGKFIINEGIEWDLDSDSSKLFTVDDLKDNYLRELLHKYSFLSFEQGVRKSENKEATKTELSKEILIENELTRYLKMLLKE